MTDEEVAQAGGNQLVNGKRYATDQKMFNDAIKMMEAQTIATFSQEMADRHVTDYVFKSIVSTANFATRPYMHRDPDYVIVGGPWKVSCVIQGTTTITFDDVLPVAIAAIVTAIAAALVAHASLIVLVAVLTFVAIVAVTIFHVVVTDIATGAQTIADAVKTATSTTGGTVVTTMVVIAAVIVAGVLFFVFLWPKLKDKLGEAKSKAKGMRLY